MKDLVIISNSAFSVVNFRSHFITALIDAGCRVHALAPDFTDEQRSHIHSLGAEPVDFYMDRTGQNAFKDVGSLASLYTALKKINPDVTFSYGIKPVVYGLPVSRWLGIPQRFALIAGLGTLYVDKKQQMVKNLLGRTTADVLYRFSLRFADKVFFHNPDDMMLFNEKRIVSNQKSVVVNGSGVDVDYYHTAHIQKDPIRFTLVSRLIKEKGIYEFVEAARIIKKEYIQTNIKCMLLGGVDSNPSSVQEAELNAWVKEGIIEWPGHVDEVKEWLEKTSVLVLPTYYREGTPKSILEAMAMSRPIITTDTPGCRETVDDGLNGFLITPQNVDALVASMKKFIGDPSKISEFGAKSRKKAENCYNVEDVNTIMLTAMGLR